jgi:AraC-like DNA-binding protein
MKPEHAVEERSQDFGLDLVKVPAFSLRGVWDHDSSRHLNVHHSHQILTVSDGMLVLVDDCEQQPLYRSMAAFIPAGTPHRAIVFRERNNVLCHSLFLTPRICAAQTPQIRIFEMSELGSALLKKLNEQNRVDLTTGLSGHCLRLFLELLPQDLEHQARLIRLPEVKQERNKRIAAFIRDNYMNKVRLEHLCRAVPLSSRQLARSFRDELKITIMEYLRLYRLLRASVLLHEQDRNIIDIAFDCGYDSISSFHEDFKQHFGVQPNKFRKTVLGLR